MRFYILAILLAFTIMISSPSLALAAGEFTAHSSSAKKKPAKQIPPDDRDRSDDKGHGRSDYDFNKPGRPVDHHPGRGRDNRPGRRDRDDEPRGADAIDHQKLFYGAAPTNSLMYGVIPDPNADSRSKSKSKRRHDRNRYGWGGGYSCYPYCDGTGLWYGDNDNQDDDGVGMQYVMPQEPDRSFQGGGSFERFDDPRDGKRASSGTGQQAPTQEIDQYQMMMKAWQ